ncbi:MAG: hypothetical protein JRJ18_17445 [Deltaproteobacteria bacterium]|nr:hypothetical protein [Deltaproteobacteria bacterium]
MTNFDISQYVEMALRRKWWIILPFLLAILGGLIYALGAPKIYEARTLILIQSQKVPTSFVKPIVSSGIEDRLRTISQQVTSRTNLEAIIKEYGILADRDMLPVDKVETVRKRIILDVVRGGRGGGNAFSIAYRDSNPQLCMRVANALASNFISENLKIRESQALGTSDFLADELENVRRRSPAIHGRPSQQSPDEPECPGKTPVPGRAAQRQPEGRGKPKAHHTAADRPEPLHDGADGGSGRGQLTH